MGVLVLLLGLWLSSAGAQPGSPSGASSTTVPARTAAACTSLGDPCGSCGPVGQCLQHLDARAPSRVCVNGGRCVQTGCGSDADCPAAQVCAGLGGVPACCAPCP